MAQVKTYRVLNAEGMKVGHDVRQRGELMPEAADFANLRNYIDVHHLEEIWVDESVVKDFMKSVADREKRAAEVPETPEVEEVDKAPAPAKKKTIAKKTAKKTVVKKGKTRGSLTEESV